MPAHQMFRIESDEPGPTGDGVKIAALSLPAATEGDSVTLVERGTEYERNCEIIDMVHENDQNLLVVRFVD